MNKVILIGRLTRDPELKFIPGKGTATGNTGNSPSNSNQYLFTEGNFNDEITPVDDGDMPF